MAYITVDYLQAYADSVNFDLSVYSEREVPAAIVVAADYFDAFYQFKDPITNPAPEAIQRASAMAAILHLKGELLVDSSTLASGAVKTRKSGVGPLSTEITYFDGTAPTTKRNTPLIDGLLKPYLADDSPQIRAFSVGRRC